jgi:glycosyltransferase involved in cell wall biosynthesis
VLEPRWLRAYRDVLTFTVSSSSAASLHGYGLRRIEVLPMAAPVELGPRLARVTKDPSPTFVTCGRLSRSKRPDHAVQAFRLVSQVLPDARLWLIGSGPLEERLRRDLPANAELLGHLATYDRDDRLSRAHALLMTSVREGWGLVVSESAAVGTRTIGYRVDGLVDSITACDGVLVDADPEALAQAMLDHWSAFAEAGPPPSTGTVPLEEMSQILLEHSFANAGALV